MFPYAGTNQSILEGILTVFGRYDYDTLIDPFTGSGRLQYKLAQTVRKPFRMEMNDLNFYAAANLRAVFEGQYRDTPQLADITPKVGWLSEAKFGYWNAEYRAAFDGYVDWAYSQRQQGECPHYWLLGMLGKLMLEATFRGQAWADVDASGFQVKTDYTPEKLQSQVNRVSKWINTTLRRRIKPYIENVDRSVGIHQLDVIEDRLDFLGNGALLRGGVKTLVYIDCPWPWKTTNTHAYDFYNDINAVLTGKRDALSWDNAAEYYEEKLFANFILPHLKQRSTIILNKQSVTLPPIEGLVDRMDAYQLEHDIQFSLREVGELPIRGRQGVAMTDASEKLFELRAI